jgi:hypothetical protein
VLHGGHEWLSVSSMESNGEGLTDAIKSPLHVKRTDGAALSRTQARGRGCSASGLSAGRGSCTA